MRPTGPTTSRSAFTLVTAAAESTDTSANPTTTANLAILEPYQADCPNDVILACQALLAGQRMVVPGLLNKLCACWLRLAPHALVFAVAGVPRSRQAA